MDKGERGLRVLEEGREQKLPGLLHAGDIELCSESEENLLVMIGKGCTRGMKGM